MTSSCMIYQPTQNDTPVVVDVYAFTPMYDSATEMYNVIATGWCEEHQNWITAPVWCFKPKKTKTLNS